MLGSIFLVISVSNEEIGFKGCNNDVTAYG